MHRVSDQNLRYELQSRRQFIGLLASAPAAFVACTMSGNAALSRSGSARLASRPGLPGSTVSDGTWPINPNDATDGVLVVPPSYHPAHPAALVIALHGAGGSPNGPVKLLGTQAAAHGVLLLVPKSRGPTWDAITGRYGPDVRFIDNALKWTFDQCVVDPARVVVEGFSDGASYALGLGLANGDLFKRAVAFSPGFIPAPDSITPERPEFFISHGRADQILPIDDASRVIVPGLRSRGVTVNYVEFDGGHQVPPAIARSAMDWMLSP